MFGKLQHDTYKLKRIYIESKLPEELKPLQRIANNVWWSWNSNAIELFQSIMPDRWEALHYNPISVIEELSFERGEELKKDPSFMNKLHQVEQDFNHYMGQFPDQSRPSVAYFCMEYGLHISLRLYSGGLGILAGDFLKEASDSNVDMIAVGLLYRYGYFQQSISLHGDQINHYPPQQFTKLPISPVRGENGEWLKVSINLRGRTVWAKIWVMKVGRISLYLLDADIDENDWQDRSLTHQLYGGDNEHRLKQEILLGIGGTRALEAMNIKQEVYHCNEGHAAFLGLERIKQLKEKQNLTNEEAIEVVRASSLFTTHTPVPAGHDYFSEGLLKAYLGDYVHNMGIQWKNFMSFGKVDVDDVNENFSMSHLAIRLSQEVNGVSALHGKVSQEMFKVLYPGYNAEENHIGHVTNSVHYPTWISKEWHTLYESYFGDNFLADQSNPERWAKIIDVQPSRIWSIRQLLKRRLIEGIKTQLKKDLTRRGENPKSIFEQINSIAPDAMVIGFARRFATYKRANLLFSNIERLSSILNHSNTPVIFVFSGKAHPADRGGQDLIKNIINISKRPEFLGKIIFLENYNMEIAKLMLQGVDMWLNTPTRPMEASGTSGMKAALNGVVNFSVLDGWWAEGYRSDAGWSLPLERNYEDQHLQNELDAETIYNTLEFDIIPTYFDRDQDNIPNNWIFYIKNTIGQVAPHFTMKRMMDDYFDRYYNKLAKRSKQLLNNNFQMTRDIIKWKDWMKQQWSGIRVESMNLFDTDNFALQAGDAFKAEITLFTNQIRPTEIGMEVVFFRRIDEEQLEVHLVESMPVIVQSDQYATYACNFNPKTTGVYEYGFRVFPQHSWMPHRQDLNLITWL